MNLGESRNELDNGGNGASLSPRLASLPRYTAKAIEQLMDTMLAALRSDTGAIWVEHEHSVYTLVVRNVSIQNLQLLQQMTRTRAPSSPVLLQSQGQSYAVSCTGYPLLRVYVALKVEKIGSLHHRLMPRFARLAQSILQANNSPIGTPAEDPSYQAYRVIVENSLRRLCELMQAAGCTLLWFSSWNNSWHRFAIGSEIEWLRVSVQMMAASLDVLETQSDLLQKVYQDPLTGLFNRLYFEVAYRQILHGAQRHPRPVSLLLMDVDNFKQINDTYGHETGDIVLQVVGQVLQQVRAGDIPARYGGDEFVILLPDTDKAGARMLAQRLQQALKQATEQLELPCEVTLSIGCATVSNGDTSLLLLADQDMYEQKRREKAAVSSLPESSSLH
jgi:diguanylate cyclase (GGDEF)-like protein